MTWWYAELADGSREHADFRLPRCLTPVQTAVWLGTKPAKASCIDCHAAVPAPARCLDSLEPATASRIDRRPETHRSSVNE